VIEWISTMCWVEVGQQLHCQLHESSGFRPEWRPFFNSIRRLSIFPRGNLAKNWLCARFVVP
jgi:hypothetical protein